MREALHGGLREAPLPGCFRVDVPRRLQGAGVEARYACATFLRSVAVQYPASEVEFIHRLHPLARALGDQALRELTVEPARNNLGSRIAARRHPLAARQPFAVFTFQGRDETPSGQVFGIAIDVAGKVLDNAVAQTLLWDEVDAPGEASWAAIEQGFGDRFASMQAIAAQAALEHLRQRAARLRGEREGMVTVLREEASLYRVDRLAEIKEDEATERAGNRDQMEMFREAATNWDARRAAVETHYRSRLEEIVRFADVQQPPAPQALGVLLVLAPEAQ